MAYVWYHLPVSIRFVGKESYANSGVHLILKDDNSNYILDFVLTVNTLPDVPNYKLLVSSGSKNNLVQWHRAIYENQYVISDPDFHEHLSHFKTNGFRFIPHDIANIRDIHLSVLKCKLEHNWDFYQDNSFQYKPINFTKCSRNDLGKPISIVSYPFNFTNSLLFANFVSNGNINYIMEGKSPLGYLSDVKYLENMLGGIVYLQNSIDSFGLIGGNLKKYNGDGDLVLILSWNLLLEVFRSDPKLKLLSIKQQPWNSEDLAPFVFPILVKSKLSSSWGSCILFNQTTLITNNHVINPFVQNDNYECIIYFSKTVSISLTAEDNIRSHEGLDLAFIKLSSSNQQKLNQIGYTPPDISVGCEIGDQVVSKGFGLFFNTKSILPITSSGIINTKLALPSFEGSSKSLDSVIITSSSCWNGSSGGGLFKDNKLVGMICSNAQINLPIFGSEPKQIEKLSKVAFVLPIDLINYCYNGSTGLNPKIFDLWNLKPFHADTVVELAKL